MVLGSNFTIKNMDNEDYIVDVATGEIISTYDEYKKIREEKIKSLEIDHTIVKKQFGIVDKFETHKLGWNLNRGNPKHFIKEFSSFQKEVHTDMTLQEVGLISVLTNFLEYETNRVVINGKNPSNKDIAELTKLSTTSIKVMLSSLEKMNLIKRVGKRQARKIYVNPGYAFKGQDLCKKTYDLFYND